MSEGTGDQGDKTQLDRQLTSYHHLQSLSQEVIKIILTTFSLAVAIISVYVTSDARVSTPDNETVANASAEVGVEPATTFLSILVGTLFFTVMATIGLLLLFDSIHKLYNILSLEQLRITNGENESMAEIINENDEKIKKANKLYLQGNKYIIFSTMFLLYAISILAGMILVEVSMLVMLLALPGLLITSYVLYKIVSYLPIVYGRLSDAYIAFLSLRSEWKGFEHSRSLFTIMLISNTISSAREKVEYKSAGKIIAAIPFYVYMGLLMSIIYILSMMVIIVFVDDWFDVVEIQSVMPV